MDKYLKMADVFVHDSVEELEQHIYAGYMSKHCSEYAAHAINSHDELVQMNQDLLNALESIENDAGQVPKFMWDMIQATIAKAKGGAV